MDFYEELGVPRCASLDEIRSSYRQRALLLHPDRYPNAELRAIAEAEMQRVNVIAGILTHPEERLQYDRTLIGEGVAVDQGKELIARTLPSRRRLDIRVVLCLVAVAAISLTCILALRFDSGSVPSVPLAAASLDTTALANPAQPVSLPDPVPPSRIEGKQGVDTETSVVEFAKPKRIPAPSRSEPPGADKPLRAQAPAPARANSEPRPAEPAVVPHIVAADAPVLLPPEEIRPAHRSADLVGLWRYARPPQRQVLPGGFAAQNVEVGITRQLGVIYGYFEGRYVGPQGRTTSEVSFQFSGTAESGFARTTWSSTDGSHGEITLHMLSEDSLEVVWVASHPGRRGRLASGKITLARVQ